MKPALRKTLSGGPPPYPTKMKGWCANIHEGHYYASVFQFANLIHYAAGGFSGGATDNANGYPTNMPSGWAGSLNCMFGGDAAPVAHFAAGDYVVRPPTGFIATIGTFGGTATWTNVVQGTSGSPNATFTMPVFAPGVPNTQTLAITLTNNTGGTVAAFDREPFAGRVADLANHDAGFPWNGVFVESLRGCNTIRVGDLMGFNNNGASHSFDGTHLRTEANLRWAQSSLGNEQMAPITACAKLCQRVGAILWLIFPGGNEEKFYGASAATDILTVYRGAPLVATAHGYSDNDPVVLWGYANAAPGGVAVKTIYYVATVAGQPTQLKLRATPGGAAINLTTDIDQSSYGYGINKLVDPLTYYTSMVQKVKDTFPTVRILPEIENESWNPQYQRGFMDVAAVQSGRTLTGNNDDGAMGYLWLASKAWKAIETLLSRGQCLRTHMMQNGNFGNFGGALSLTDPGVISAGTAYKDLIDQCCTAAYFGVQDYPPGLITRGAITWTAAQWLAEFVASNTGLANSTASTVNPTLTVKPGMRYVLYEAGYGIQYQRAGETTPTTAQVIALGDAIAVFMRTPEAASGVRDYLSRVLDANGVAGGCFWNEWQFYTGDFMNGLGTIRYNDEADTSYSSVIKAWKGS